MIELDGRVNRATARDLTKLKEAWEAWTVILTHIKFLRLLASRRAWIIL